MVGRVVEQLSMWQRPQAKVWRHIPQVQHVMHLTVHHSIAGCTLLPCQWAQPGQSTLEMLKALSAVAFLLRNRAPHARKALASLVTESVPGTQTD